MVTPHFFKLNTLHEILDGFLMRYYIMVINADYTRVHIIMLTNY